MARVTFYTPRSLHLSQFGAQRTLPPVLAEHPLVAQFDSDTLFFDVFSLSPNAVLCLGPPLDACLPPIQPSTPRRTGNAVRTQTHRIRQQFSNRTLLTGTGAGRESAIELEANGVLHRADVSPDASELLARRRVVVTLSKDNPLHWIRDWAEFYVRQHGADAILIYENGSSGYTPPDIGAALESIEGLAEIVIVDWPFPYGAGGPASGQPALDNFCQTGALDHARRCLCRKSRSVLNVDIDELLIADGASIFERVERSPHAALLFHGIWAEAPGITDAGTLQTVRHSDCIFAWREQLEAFAMGRLTPLCRSKWVAVPSRCSEHLEWGIHEVYAATRWGRLTRRFWLRRDAAIAFRHCRQINTGWKIERWRTSPDFEQRCVADRAMSAAMTDVFGAAQTQPPRTPQ